MAKLKKDDVEALLWAGTIGFMLWAWFSVIRHPPRREQTAPAPPSNALPNGATGQW